MRQRANGARVQLYSSNNTNAPEISIWINRQRNLQDYPSNSGRWMCLADPLLMGRHCSNMMLLSGSARPHPALLMGGIRAPFASNIRVTISILISMLIRVGCWMYLADPVNWAALRQYTEDCCSAVDSGSRQDCAGVNKAVDIPGGNAVQQAQLQLYSPNGTVAQRWLVIKAPLTLRERLNETAAKHRQDLPDGTYTFGSKLPNTSMKMDVMALPVQIMKRADLAVNGTNAQKWKVTHDSNDT